MWLQNTTHPILSHIWFDQQTKDYLFGNHSAEIVYGDSTDYDPTGWILDLSPDEMGPVEWTDAMARLKNGDGGGPSGHYAYETTRRESGALPTTSYPARGAESDPAVNPTVFSTGDPKFGQNNKYIDRSTRCVSFFFLKTAKLKDSEA